MNRTLHLFSLLLIISVIITPKTVAARPTSTTHPVLSQPLSPQDIQALPKKPAIVIGTPSDIQEKILLLLATNGYSVGLITECSPIAYEIQKDNHLLTTSKHIHSSDKDTSPLEQYTRHLTGVIQELGGVDLVCITIPEYHTGNLASENAPHNYPASNVDPHNLSAHDLKQIQFMITTKTLLNFFEEQGHGFLITFAASHKHKHEHNHNCKHTLTDTPSSRYIEAQKNYHLQKNSPVIILNIRPESTDTLEQIKKLVSTLPAA